MPWQFHAQPAARCSKGVPLQPQTQVSATCNKAVSSGFTHNLLAKPRRNSRALQQSGAVAVPRTSHC